MDDCKLSLHKSIRNSACGFFILPWAGLCFTRVLQIRKMMSEKLLNSHMKGSVQLQIITLSSTCNHNCSLALKCFN